MSIIIRKAKEDDIKSIQKICNKCIGTYSIYLPEELKKYTSVVAEDTNTQNVIGVIIIGENESNKFRSIKHEIRGIAVVGRFRRQGVAENLIKELDKYNYDALICEAWTFRSNTARLHTPLIRNGFKLMDKIKNHWRAIDECKDCADSHKCKDNDVCDNHIYVKDFKE